MVYVYEAASFSQDSTLQGGLQIKRFQCTCNLVCFFFSSVFICPLTFMCTPVPVHVYRHVCEALVLALPQCMGYWNVLMGVDSGIFVMVLCLGAEALSEACQPY